VCRIHTADCGKLDITRGKETTTTTKTTAAAAAAAAAGA